MRGLLVQTWRLIRAAFEWRTVRYSCSGTETMKVLNVAEKNDAAKNIAQLLSGGTSRRRDGMSKYNKIYEFDYMVQGRRCQMLMTSVSGHLLNYDFVGSYRKWLGCAPLALFEAPVQKICHQDYQPVKNTLEREARSSKILIIWTDCDREGENIGYEVINVCTAVNPTLEVYRAKFSEITKASVTRAVQNLIRPDKNTSDAVDVRQELDLRIGAAFTRFQTLRLKRVFPNVLGDSLISYGSCQFPTLGFVVERYKAIDEFIKEPFWKIEVEYRNGEDVAQFNWKRIRLFNRECCLAILEECQEEPTATVLSVKSKPKTKRRPLPLDTVELEKLASRKLRINAKETMQIAERLYVQGFISYPRTETNIFPNELNLAPLVEMQTEDQNWGEFARQVLENGPNPSHGKKSDQAHPPIHPTKYAPALQGNDRRVYEFIVRHFLACLSDDAKGKETKVEIEIVDERFEASGLTILARNYLEVYLYERWSDKNIPDFTEGQTFEPSRLEMVEGETSPPPLLTEADLIALMEKHGIGTDATHADHIETIKNRTYVGVQNGHFLPGQLGMGLVEGYDAMGFALSKPRLRAALEADLKCICEGTKQPDTVLRDQIREYRTVFEKAMDKANLLDENVGRYLGEDQQQFDPNEFVIPDPVTLMKCPSCSSDMSLKQRKDGTSWYLSCMTFPNCRSAVWFPGSVIKVAADDATCQTCNGNPPMLKFTFKKGAYAPLYPDNYVACICGCDRDFLELLDITWPPAVSNSTAVPQAARPNFQPTFNVGTPGNGLMPRGARGGRGRRGRGGGRGGGGRGGRTGSDESDDGPDGRGGRGGRGRGRRRGQKRPGGDTSDQSAPKRWPDSDSGAATSSASQGVSRLTDFFANNNRRGGNQRTSGAGASSGGNDSGFASGTSGGSHVQPNNSHFQPNNGPFREWNPGPSTSGYTPQQNQTSGGADETDATKCQCDLPAKLLHVKKEGPNQGRPFYRCAIFPAVCNFFAWGDEQGSSDAASAGRTSFGNSRPERGRGRGWNKGGGHRGGQKGGGRKCSVCGMTGHNKKNCPQNGD